MNSSLGKYLFIATCTIPLMGSFNSISLFGVVPLNHSSYLVAIIPLIVHIFIGRPIPIGYLIFLVAVCIPGFYNYLFGSAFDFGSNFRFAIALVPILFWRHVFTFLKNGKSNTPYVTIYLAGVIIAVCWAFLQMFDILPYYDFDYIDGERIGRASGGYKKPVIFNIVLFPVFLYVSVNYYKNKFSSLILFSLLLFLVWLTGLRTAFIVYTVMAVMFIFKDFSFRLSMFFVKYYGPFLFGIILISVISLAVGEVPLLTLLRGRLGMWIAHVHEMTSNGLMPLLFGKGGTLLSTETQLRYEVYSVSEVHNDYLRLIVVHGVFGLILFSYFIRKYLFGLYAIAFQSKPVHNHLISSYVAFLFLFMVTNEPTYYPAVMWVSAISLIYFANYSIELKFDSKIESPKRQE